MKSTFHCVALASAVCWVSGAAWPQTSSNTKPSVPAKVASKGTMTRDELRACMQLQEKIRERAVAVDAAKPAMESERQRIEPAKAELDALRAEVEIKKDQVKKSDDAVREFSAVIDQWNTDVKEAEESPMKSAERRKKELQSQQPGLVARNKELLKARETLFSEYEMAIAKFNERGKVLELDILAWNQRNRKLADEADSVSELREDYSADCSARRFREEDEMAIKQGK